MQTTTTSRTYAIDPVHSEVGFAVRHLMITTIRGNFTGFSGTITLPPTGDIPTKIEGAVDTTTVASREEKRDVHLRAADFLDTDNFPRISFVSTSITGSGRDFTIVGDLTMHDITKSVTLKGEAGGTTTDPWGNFRFGMSATGRINRSDFGITFSAALESGVLIVSDEVDITIEVSAVQIQEL
jgi:polyisoprenoid-binding protein YceI